MGKHIERFVTRTIERIKKDQEKGRTTTQYKREGRPSTSSGEGRPGTSSGEGRPSTSSGEGRPSTSSAPRDYRRTLPCKFFRQGRCTRGDQCNFSHDVESNRETERTRDRSRENPPRERRPSERTYESHHNQRARTPSRDRRTVIQVRPNIVPVSTHE